MKLGAVLEDRIASGGGYNQALNALLQMQRLSAAGGFEFVVYSAIQENVPTLERLGIKAVETRLGLSDWLLKAMAGSLAARRITKKLRLTGRLERHLLADGCDLVYFISPGARALSLNVLNYISTIWDQCHRDFPEFPEVRGFGEFYRRETEVRSTLAQSILVLVDADQSRTLLHERYGIDSHRVLAMPFSPAPLIHDGNDGVAATLERLALAPGYLFYPAQFWPHKNHARLLQALSILKAKGRVLNLVLSGGDKGSGGLIDDIAGRLGLGAQIRKLGFVAADDMQAVYMGSAAVVMPTYFGPTNLPPLEAWMTGRPLVYPKHLAGQAGDAAVLFDVDDPDDLAKAIEEALDPAVRARLEQAGHRRLDEIDVQRQAAETELLARLKQFSRRRECWK